MDYKEMLIYLISELDDNKLIESLSSFISLNDIYNQNNSINIQSNVIQENYLVNIV